MLKLLVHGPLSSLASRNLTLCFVQDQVSFLPSVGSRLTLEPEIFEEKAPEALVN